MDLLAPWGTSHIEKEQQEMIRLLPLQSAQLLAAGSRSLQEVLSSLTSDASYSSSRRHSSSSSSTSDSQPQQCSRRIPENGPGLADFIQGSRPTIGGASAASSSISSSTHDQPDGASLSKRVFIETYGCQMNVSDSEVIASVLSAQQYTDAQSAADAGVVLLNTCAIRENAEARIWGRLAELQSIKKQRRRNKQTPLVVGVLGCMAERLKSKLLDQQNLADLVVGPDAYRDLPRIIAAVQAGEAEGAAAMNVQLSLDETYADITPVRQNPDCMSAFVSIMRGCNNMCAFCIVPFTRGRERSRPVDSILREIEQLSEQGVKEVTLLGQNVNSYADMSHLQQQQQQEGQQASSGSSSGSSRQNSSASVYAPGFSSVSKPKRDGAVQFAELLERVAQVNPEMRVRFTSPHPKDFTEDVLQVIATSPNVASLLHMPAQSGSSSTLQRMRRGYTREAYDALVQRVRSVIPNVALSTDMIIGFCGETEEEHAASLDLLRSTRYDNAFLFSYSERGKTYASRHLPDDVPDDVKRRRLAEAFEAYRAGQAELNQQELGRVHLVLLDGRPRRGGEHSLQGRTCSMKRAIIPEQPVPASLTDLQQHLQGAATAWLQGAAAGRSNGSSSSSSPVYSGPVSSLQAGDYVAVYVQQLGGTSTLLSQPLAKTSIREFARVFGSTTPGVQAVPAWLLAAAVAAAPAGDEEQRLWATAGQL